MNDLISKIQTELPGFSKGQKQIARYILEHYDKAAFMTASRLGVTVGVSESTVVRFATELGYDGYPHLQRALHARTGAHRSYILGVRSSSALANFLGFYFNLLFDNVTLVHTNSVSEIFEQVLRVGPGDVLFGISFPRYSKRTLSARQYARDRGAKVIALTVAVGMSRRDEIEHTFNKLESIWEKYDVYEKPEDDIN